MAFAVDRRRHELRTLGHPLRVAGLDVGEAVNSRLANWRNQKAPDQLLGGLPGSGVGSGLGAYHEPLQFGELDHRQLPSATVTLVAAGNLRPGIGPWAW